jgi:hypothetical protein
MLSTFFLNAASTGSDFVAVVVVEEVDVAAVGAEGPAWLVATAVAVATEALPAAEHPPTPRANRRATAPPPLHTGPAISKSPVIS